MADSYLTYDINLLEIDSFATASKSQLYIVSLRDKHFEVSESVAQLIDTLKANSSIESAAIEFSSKMKRDFSPENVEEIITRYINPIFDETKKKSPFFFNKELISAQAIAPLTSILSNLFRPTLAWPLLIIVTLSQLYFLFHSSFQFHPNGYGELLSLLIFSSLSFASIVFHELGHASACKFYGVDHGHIGVGVYLHLPVFYADVSNVWKLKRRERLVVDLAGIFFQMIFLVPMIVTYFYTQSVILEYLIYGTIISFLFDLNPFLKLDGYWICSDLLGIPNLRKRTIEILVYCIAKLKGKPVNELPYLFKIKPLEQWSLIIYTMLVNCFFGYFLLYRMPLFIYNSALAIPLKVQQIINSSEGKFKLIVSFGVQLFFTLLIVYFIYRTIVSLVRFTFKHIL
jgi:putative peptide zinc metalloprotease protein